MKEDRTIRSTVECAGGSLSVAHPQEGDIVEVHDIDALDVSVTSRDKSYNEIHIGTVPKRKGESDEGTFYIEGDGSTLKNLHDILGVAVRNIEDMESE